MKAVSGPRVLRRLAAIGLCAAWAMLASGCSSPPLDIPTGIVPRAEPIEPEMVARLMADIDAERAQVTARLTAEEAECYQRFVVTRCLVDTRARYRPLLNALNQREVAARAGARARVEAERQVRVEEQRLQSLVDQQRAQERAASAVPQAQRQSDLDQRNAERAASAPANAARAQANRSSAQQAHDNAVAEQARRAAAAPGERGQYEERQRAAAERRAAQARRAAEQSGKTPAQPLPTTPQPPSPSVPVR